MPHPDTIRLFLTILAFVFLAGVVIRPFYGLLSYLIIMMVRPGAFYPLLGELRIELIVGVLIIVIVVMSPERLARLQPSSDPIIKIMFVLFGIMCISMIQAMDFKNSYDWMNEFAKVFLFFIMIVSLLDTERDIEIFLIVFGILTFMIGYDAIYNFHSGFLVKSLSDERVDYSVASGGMGSGHVALANLNLQGLPIIWYMLVCSRIKLLKLSGVVFFSLCLYAVIISGSRAGFVGLISFGICLIIFSERRFVMFAGILGLIICLPFISATGYMDYISTLLNIGSATGATGSDRISGLRNGFEMMIRRPILGVGPGCYPIARKAWFGWGLWAHNHYGELMGDLGITGTVVWFMFFKSYFMKAWLFVREKSGDSVMSNICLAVVVASIVRLVIGMGTHSVYIFFWYMMAGVMVSAMRTWENFESGKAVYPEKL